METLPPPLCKLVEFQNSSEETQVLISVQPHVPQVLQL